MGERLENYAWSMIDGCIKISKKKRRQAVTYCNSLLKRVDLYNERVVEVRWENNASTEGQKEKKVHTNL
jgi:hypothetical protein